MTLVEKRLLYFGHTPMEGAGSAIIVLRHLRRLAEKGWSIYVVSDWGQSTQVCEKEGWPVLFLPHRKLWWPPLNTDNPILLSLRLWLWAGICYKFIGRIKPAAAFTYLSAFSVLLSQVAVGFSRRYGVPLSVIIHDNPEYFCNSLDNAVKTRKHYQRVIKNAHQNWYASPQLADLYNVLNKKESYLPPIPEGWKGYSTWLPDYSERPLLVYAGNLWEVQLPLMRIIANETKVAGGRLMLIVNKNPAVVEFCNKHQVELMEPFEENNSALDFIAANAAAVLVSYTETSDTMPWIKTSFPSKFVEYTHLGIPILIMAPVDSAVAIWARENNFLDSIPPNDMEGLKEFIESIKLKSRWQQKAASTRQIANSEFNPVTIQKKFESRLTV